MRLVDAGVTVKDRIILHLLDHWGQLHGGEWPPTLTQDGIASVVGISRSHVAVTLPDLIDDGLVEAKVERVRGRPRRVKVYSLTYEGGRHAGMLAQRLLPSTVTAIDDTGEWDLPLDGLVQVHRVHMLTALRLVDEDNHVDLRRVADVVGPRAKGPAISGEAAEGEEEAEGDEGKAEEEEEEEDVLEEEWVEPIEVAADEDEVPGGAPAPQHATLPPSSVAPRAGTPWSPQPGQPTQVLRGIPPPGRAPPGQQPGGPPVSHGSPGQPFLPQPQYGQHPRQYQVQGYPPQAYFWSPLRFGSGHRPTPGVVAFMMVAAFLSLLGGAVLFGLGPGYCLAIWLPLMVVGCAFTYFWMVNSWALGPKRETWVAAALAATMFVGVTWVTFAVFGYEVLIDLAWLGLILGFPSLVLAVGSGRATTRRGAFSMFIGPVLVIAALTLGVLDPEGFGATGAMPLLVVSVGASWAFVGWVMVRHQEPTLPLRTIIAGGAVGLALATVVGGTNLWTEGDLTAPAAIAVSLWVVLALYVVIVSLAPSAEWLRPDANAIYSSLAIAGGVALVTASVIFINGGLFFLAAVEIVIAVGMVGMVAPDMARSGMSSRLLAILGSVVAAASVFAVSVTL